MTHLSHTLPVRVKSDYLEEIQKVTPQLALLELIWNSLDADADEVQITFDLSPLGGVERIHVQDDGTGINYEDVTQVFGNLGGSWKKEERKSLSKERLLHGAAGRGRFRAFRLGQTIEWRICVSDGLLTKEFAIQGSSSELETLSFSDCVISDSSPGVEVVVSNVVTNLSSLVSSDTRETLTQRLAPYLTNYPQVKIWYDGKLIDPADAIKDQVDQSSEAVALTNGTSADISISIYEWKAQTKSTFILCDAEGFPRHELSSPMHTLGYDFTAYIKSHAFRQLDDANALSLEEMDPDVQALIEAAKKNVREHFLAKTAQAASFMIERMQEQRIYPYKGEPKNPVEKAERQVFDVLAHSLSNYLPGFNKSSSKEKEFTLRLLRTSVENGPEEVGTILREVLDLQPAQQAELNRLLQKTTLSAIIKAAKVVADRQDFLAGLKLLLFEAEPKEKLRERTQLHKILERETWIFGEEYNLTNSDQGLEKVLVKHIAMLRPNQNTLPASTAPVAVDGQSRGIIDLMLSRKVMNTNPSQREHLIVELKRPTQKIDQAVISQIKMYARAVARDERFADTETQWTFWALSNEMDDFAKEEANQDGRPKGVIYQKDNVTVWAKTWGQVIESCSARLEFYEKELQYKADDASATEYLTEVHEKFLPPGLPAT